jgi:hypothetical protein
MEVGWQPRTCFGSAYQIFRRSFGAARRSHQRDRCGKQQRLAGERLGEPLGITSRVIYDTNAIAEASDEVKSKLKRLSKIVTE